MKNSLPFIFLALLLYLSRPLQGAEPRYQPVREFPADTKGSSAEDRARLRQIRDRMHQIIFPKIDFREATPKVAVDWITRMAGAYSPDGKGMSMVFQSSNDAKPLPNITLEMQNVTLPQVLDAICRQMDYLWFVTPYALTLVPREVALR